MSEVADSGVASLRAAGKPGANVCWIVIEVSDPRDPLRYARIPPSAPLR